MLGAYSNHYGTNFSPGNGGKGTEEPTEVINLKIEFVTVIDACTVIFICNNLLHADGSNTGVMNGCCSINASFVYVIMSCRSNEMLLKNTMLESPPRIIRHNINAYNRMFQSGLPLSKCTLLFESMNCFHSGIMTYTKCFISIAVGYTKFSLGSGGKRAEKPTELLHFNIGFVRVDYFHATIKFSFATMHYLRMGQIQVL